MSVNRSENIGQLVTALAVAQADFEPIFKGRENTYTHSKYAELQDIIKATQPALSKNGLVIIQVPLRTEQEAGVSATLAHKSGEFYSVDLLLPATMKAKEGGTKFDAQSIGSAVTYARRYTWQSLIGVAAENDDDGEAAVGRENSSQSEQGNRPPTRNPRPAPPVNQNPAKTGGSKPGDAKPVPRAALNAPTIAPAVDFPHEKASGAPVLPSAADLDAVAKEQEIAASTAKSVVSENPEPDRIADSGAKPDKTAFDAYVARAIALKQPLEKVGLKPSKGLQTGAKIKNNLLASAGAKELADLTVSQWEAWLGVMEPLAKTNPSNAVEVIEGSK